MLSRMKHEIFKSYEQYKHTDSGKPGSVPNTSDYIIVDVDKSDSEIDQPKNPAKPEKPAGFWTRIKGTFFMFSGYLGNPKVRACIPDNNNSLIVIDTLPDPNSNPFENHYGIYDYLTLGIPYVLEYFFRGNWLNSEPEQFKCKLCFSFIPIPIVPILAGFRWGFGLIATVFASPVVFGLWLPDAYRYKMEQKNKREEEEAKEKYKGDIASFNKQYVELKKLFKTNNNRTRLESFIESVFGYKDKRAVPETIFGQANVLLEGGEFWYTEINEKEENRSYWKEIDEYGNEKTTEGKRKVVGLNQQAKSIPEAVKIEEGLFFDNLTKTGKRLEKIKGKYSAQAFEKTFCSQYLFKSTNQKEEQLKEIRRKKEIIEFDSQYDDQNVKLV